LKTPSRRLSQRRNKRLAKKRLKNRTCNSQTNTHLQCVKHRCFQSFGFCADPCLTLQKTLTLPYPPLTLRAPTNNLGIYPSTTCVSLIHYLQEPEPY
jgi:hypothetical protein